MEDGSRKDGVVCADTMTGDRALDDHVLLAGESSKAKAPSKCSDEDSPASSNDPAARAKTGWSCCHLKLQEKDIKRMLYLLLKLCYIGS